MRKKKEMQTVYYYLNNTLSAALSKDKEDDLLRWAEKYCIELFGIDLEYAWGSAKGRLVYRHERKSYWAGLKDHIDNEKQLVRCVKNLRAMLAPKKIVDITAEGYDGFIDMVLRVFKISPRSRDILRFIINHGTNTMISDLKQRLCDWPCWNMNESNILAAMMGVSDSALEKAFDPDGEFFIKGIVVKESDGEIHLSAAFKTMYRAKPKTEARIKDLMFGKPLAASLTRDHFSYIADDYDHIRTLLSNAVSERAAGVNILIYGEPGTGLCKAIAADVGELIKMLESEQSVKGIKAAKMGFA